MKRLRVCPCVWSERTPGHPVRLLSRRLLPIVVLVRCCSVQVEGLTPGPRGSYCSIPSRRRYLLEIVEARLHGEGLSVFSRGVLMYLRQVGVVPILSCMENIELWCVGAVGAA